MPYKSFRDRLVVSYRNSTSNHNSQWSLYSFAWLYLIEILHQTTTPFRAFVKLCCCILSKFYIKPQRCKCHYVGRLCCILSKFYIKPQLVPDESDAPSSCILSKFYIKPQLKWQSSSLLPVVSYRNSTSNHNNARRQWRFQQVVSYRNSTSNHNS